MMTTLSDGVAPLIIIIGPAVPGINDNECWHYCIFGHIMYFLKCKIYTFTLYHIIIRYRL